MLRRVPPPRGHAPVAMPEAAAVAAPATAPSRPVRLLAEPQKPKRTRTRPSVPMTGPAADAAPSRRLPDLVTYIRHGDAVRRHWVPGFTRRGPGVPEGWHVEGSPEEQAARKEAGL